MKRATRAITALSVLLAASMVFAQGRGKGKDDDSDKGRPRGGGQPQQRGGGPPQQQRGGGGPPQQQRGGGGAPPQIQRGGGSPQQQRGGGGPTQIQRGAPPQQQRGGGGPPANIQRGPGQSQQIQRGPQQPSRGLGQQSQSGPGNQPQINRGIQRGPQPSRDGGRQTVNRPNIELNQPSRAGQPARGGLTVPPTPDRGAIVRPGVGGGTPGATGPLLPGVDQGSRGRGTTDPIAQGRGRGESKSRGGQGDVSKGGRGDRGRGPTPGGDVGRGGESRGPGDISQGRGRGGDSRGPGDISKGGDRGRGETGPGRGRGGDSRGPGDISKGGDRGRGGVSRGPGDISRGGRGDVGRGRGDGRGPGDISRGGRGDGRGGDISSGGRRIDTFGRGINFDNPPWVDNNFRDRGSRNFSWNNNFATVTPRSHFHHGDWHRGDWGWRHNYWFPYWGYRPWSIGWGIGPAWVSFGPAALAAPWTWGYYSYWNPYWVAPTTYAVPYYVDYSQPIVVAAASQQAAPDPTVQEQAAAIFERARTLFREGRYEQAQAEIDRAIALVPSDPLMHEFRALTFFAQGDYQQAAATYYAVLSMGPGWDWNTLSEMYPDVTVYTSQLRALENFRRQNPNDAAARFVLAYQYLVGGHEEAAATELEKVVALQPTNLVASQLLKGLRDDAPPALAIPQQQEQPVQQGTLIGNWQAQGPDGSQFRLALTPDQQFTWTVGDRTMTGNYMLQDNHLVLKASETNSLVGAVTMESPDKFNFRLAGDNPNDPGLTFTK